MTAFKNEAAWIMTEKAKELEVRESPVPNPTAEEVVIKVAYAAVNPTDWKVSALLHQVINLIHLRCKIIPS